MARLWQAVMLLMLLVGVCLTLQPASVWAEDEDPGVQIHPYGDFRFRGELTSFPETLDRFRPRVRLRVGASVDLGHGLRVGARVITGDPDDPRSAHQTLGEGGTSFTLSMDRVFVEYRPGALEGLRLLGGKFPNVLRRPTVVRGLVMDNDVQPTGIIANWKGQHRLGFDVSLGHYIMDERADGGETTATVGQVGLLIGDTGDLQLRLYADAFLMDIADSTTVDRLGHPTGRGNLVQNMLFVSDFHVLTGFLELEVPVGEQRWVLSTGAVHNLRAFEHRNDRGWFVGTRIGRIAGWGTGRTYVQYQEMEQEALFSPWAQDELPDDRGSRYRALLGGVVLGLTETMTVHTWVLTSTLLDPGPSEPTSWIGRFRLDLNIRF